MSFPLTEGKMRVFDFKWFRSNKKSLNVPLSMLKKRDYLRTNIEQGQV